MPIPENQLRTWTRQGAVSTAKKTHESIRNALSGQRWSEYLELEVYLQGSYKNTTNIRGDSDVDIVVQLTSIFQSNLTEEQKRRFWFIKANYGWQDFYRDVHQALKDYYRSWRVEVGKKCLKVQTPYLPADVVVCLQYRKYPQCPRSSSDFVEGITFYVPTERRWVVNYPKLHYSNGVYKNQFTGGLYKPVVRMFKNARSYLIDAGSISRDLAPSYFLECFLYNVPNSLFSNNLQQTYLGILEWLVTAIKDNSTSFVCQNEQLYLFGVSSEQWSLSNATELLVALIRLWQGWR